MSVGEEFSVKATLGQGTSGIPQYEWSVTSGTIIRGQGTLMLIVRADAEGVPITASLSVGGGSEGFEKIVESCTTAVTTRPIAKPLGEFGVKNIGYVELMFDILFGELWNDPSASGFVAISGPGPKERKRLKRWADRLIKIRKFDSSRLTFVDSEKAPLGRFRIWVVPIGAEMPKMHGGSRANR